MPDEAAADDSALPPDAPSETVVTDYTAVPRMIATLQAARDLPRLRKQVLAVAALLQVVSVASWPDPRPSRVVFELLPPKGAKLYLDLIRGMVVAAVAWLRAGDMNNADVEAWLDRQIKAREPKYVLGFTAQNALRWFYDCSEKLTDRAGARQKYRAPACTTDALAVFGPDQSQPPTPDEAVRKATELLDTVCLLNAVPLARKRRAG